MANSDDLVLTLRQIGADDLADAIKSVGDGLDDLAGQQMKVGQASERAEQSTTKQVRGLADLKAGLDLAGKAFGKVKDFIEDAIKETVSYAETTRDLSRAIGATAEETSSLIQVADDVNISTGTLEAAFKAALKNGIRPTIDGLAKLSDQYLAIQDPVARSQFAMDKFGRAGLEMGKLLEMGSDVIRASAKEAKKLGLVLSGDAVKSAREFEIAMDNLGDKMDGLKFRIGNSLIPVVNSLLDTFDRGTQIADTLLNGFSEIGDQTEQEMTRAIAQLALAFGAESRQVKEASEALRNYLYIRQQVGMTEQEHNLRTAMQGVRALDVTRKASEELIEYIAAEEAGMKRAAEAANLHAAAVQRSADANKALTQAANAAVLQLTSVAQNLNTAQTLTDYAKVALSGLEEKLKSGQISSSEYAAAFSTLGINAGLVSKESLASTRGIEAVNKAFADGLINADQYAAAIARIPTAAKDGVVTLEEVGIKTTGALRKSKQDILDETGNATSETINKTADSINKSMLQISNATSAAKGLVKAVKDEILGLPEYRKIVIDIETRGQVPPSGRAAGGPVVAGVPYVVGERGPEVIVPTQAGQVIPNTIYNNTTYNVTTDRHGLAFIFERQRMAEARM